MYIGNIEVYGVIYKVRNKINNKIYIGQTIYGFDRRYKHNLFKYSSNEHLKSSINKYGIESFEISKVFDVAFSKEELDIKENSWIKIYKSNNCNFGYNKTDGGNTHIPVEETRIKLSEKSKERWKDIEYRNSLTKKLKKITSSEEYRKRMSISLLNSKNRAFFKTDDWRNFHSKLSKERWQQEEYREKAIEGIRKSWDDTRKGKASLMMKKRHEDKEYKENMSFQFKKRWNDPKQREELRKSMMKTFYMVNLETKEVKTFLGRKALADYVGRSESYVKKYMSKKLLHENKYLFVRSLEDLEA